MKKRAVLYARSAVGENDAIARQIEMCRQFATKYGYSVVAQYGDVGSGYAPVLPKRIEALAVAESNRAILICADSVRLARDVSLLIDIVTQCERRGITIIFVQGWVS